MTYVDVKYAGDAGVELIAKRWQRARTHHICDMLGCAIHPGDRYLRITGKYGGEVSTNLYCTRCEAWPDQPNTTNATPQDSPQPFDQTTKLTEIRRLDLVRRRRAVRFIALRQALDQAEAAALDEQP